MFLWFLGTAAIAVWFVFRDDRFDYRVLALGALLPDVIDVVTGGAWVMHSVVTSVAILAAVMAVARRGTVRRRRWLALPIGTFFHLVFDGAFNNTRLFWWPFGGLSFNNTNIPSFDRLGLNVVLEIAGAAMLVWLWRTNNLSNPSVRAEFIRTGQLRAGTDAEVGKC
jgi:hypothetical protein